MVKTPGITNSQEQQDYLMDIASVTGGVYLNVKSWQTDISKVPVEKLGIASSFKSTYIKNGETVLGGNEDEKAVLKKEAYVQDLRSAYEEENDKMKKAHIEQRIQRIYGGMAVIKVGANTDVELREKEDLYDDAIQAVKSAIKEGVVAGGGTTFTYISGLLQQQKQRDECYKATLTAIEAPFRQILKNAERESHDIDHRLNKSKKEYGLGFDVQVNQEKNLLDNNIIDPAKVLRVSLESAISLASVFIKTSCVINLQVKG